jgi:hypothetical protein
MKEEINAKNIEKIKLSEYCKVNKLDYRNSWLSIKEGDFPLKTTKNAKGRIFVLQESKASDENSGKQTAFGTPLSSPLSGKEVSTASNYRRNAAATGSPTDEYFFIKKGVEPFAAYSVRRGGDGSSGIYPVSETIHLCQKAYYNFAIFRNTIDAMTEFSLSKIYLRGGTAKSRNFFNNLFDFLNIYDFEDMFFREYYRSGNVFIYRFQTKTQPNDIKNLNKMYGSDASNDLVLPSRYLMLNPYDIGVQSNIVFGTSVIFYKRLNGYEIHRLRSKDPSPEEKKFFESLPKQSQDAIMAGAGTVLVPLDPERLFAVFYKKQDYEPMSIPMGFPVLKDIEWKQEMKQVDMAAARVMQQIVLLINMGYQDKNGTYMFDSKAAANMQALFTSESVGKVLVADFTTKATWAIPSIGDFLDPKKYQIVNDDIKMGLNYVLTGQDSKFANQFIQVQLFIQRLTQAREMFLNKFLIPEIKRISDLMGFKSYPTPKFEDIDLKDDLEFNRIVSRLCELGILTPEETFTAIETGRMPTAEESLESQENFRKQRDSGKYEPLIGGPYDTLKLAKLNSTMNKPSGEGNPQSKQSISTPAGRPVGTKTPQTTKKVSPQSLKGNINEEELQGYSLTKIKDNLVLSSKLRKEVKKYISNSKKIKKMTPEQEKIANDISELIMSNESVASWFNSIEKYVKNPINNNEERLKEVDSVAAKFGINPELASILVDSKFEGKVE